MADALIPVGSVVRLDGVDLLAVVLGYFVDDRERMYDYLLAPYPVGLDSTEHAILVDAEGIAEVVAANLLQRIALGLIEIGAVLAGHIQQNVLCIDG